MGHDEAFRRILILLGIAIEGTAENDEEVVAQWRQVAVALKAIGLDAQEVDDEVAAEIEDYLITEPGE